LAVAIENKCSYQLLNQGVKQQNMAQVSTYLNFTDCTEEAFLFYKSVFGGEFTSIARFGDMPTQEGMPPLLERDKQLLMHVALPILGGHVLMGSDTPAAMGFAVNVGNNIHINLETDSRAETEKLFNALSVDGMVTMPLQDVFSGAYYGSCTDKFGIQWMVNYEAK
jgi:PhnB protein